MRACKAAPQCKWQVNIWKFLDPLLIALLPIEILFAVWCCRRLARKAREEEISAVREARGRPEARERVDLSKKFRVSCSRAALFTLS